MKKLFNIIIKFTYEIFKISTGSCFTNQLTSDIVGVKVRMNHIGVFGCLNILQSKRNLTVRFSTLSRRKGFHIAEGNIDNYDKTQMIFLKRAILNFVKAYVNKKLVGVNFPDYISFIAFIQEFEPQFRISPQSLANFKKRKTVFKHFKMNPQILAFLDHIELRFPDFDRSAFLALHVSHCSSTAITNVNKEVLDNSFEDNTVNSKIINKNKQSTSTFNTHMLYLKDAVLNTFITCFILTCIIISLSFSDEEINKESVIFDWNEEDVKETNIEDLKIYDLPKVNISEGENKQPGFDLDLDESIGHFDDTTGNPDQLDDIENGFNGTGNIDRTAWMEESDSFNLDSLFEPSNRVVEPSNRVVDTSTQTDFNEVQPENNTQNETDDISTLNTQFGELQLKNKSIEDNLKEAEARYLKIVDEQTQTLANLQKTEAELKKLRDKDEAEKEKLVDFIFNSQEQDRQLNERLRLTAESVAKSAASLAEIKKKR